MDPHPVPTIPGQPASPDERRSAPEGNGRLRADVIPPASGVGPAATPESRPATADSVGEREGLRFARRFSTAGVRPTTKWSGSAGTR